MPSVGDHLRLTLLGCIEKPIPNILGGEDVSFGSISQCLW